MLYGSRGLCSKLIIDSAAHFVPIYMYAKQLSCLNNDVVFPQNYITCRWNSPLKAMLMKCLWGQKLLGTVQHFEKRWVLAFLQVRSNNKISIIHTALFKIKLKCFTYFSTRPGNKATKFNALKRVICKNLSWNPSKNKLKIWMQQIWMC